MSDGSDFFLDWCKQAQETCDAARRILAEAVAEALRNGVPAPTIAEHLEVDCQTVCQLRDEAERWDSL